MSISMHTFIFFQTDVFKVIILFYIKKYRGDGHYVHRLYIGERPISRVL